MEHLTIHTLILGGLSGANFILICYLLNQLAQIKRVVYETKGYLKGIHDRPRGTLAEG
jgi:hypothetical protein